MKKRLKGTLMVGFCAAVTTVVVIATQASGVGVLRPCGPIGIECLDVWNPVICSNGVVYSNACYARRACATGCVPY